MECLSRSFAKSHFPCCLRCPTIMQQMLLYESALYIQY
jgi:hypothetical protein